MKRCVIADLSHPPFQTREVLLFPVIPLGLCNPWLLTLSRSLGFRLHSSESIILSENISFITCGCQRKMIHDVITDDLI